MDSWQTDLTSGTHNWEMQRKEEELFREIVVNYAFVLILISPTMLLRDMKAKYDLGEKRAYELSIVYV